MSYPLPPRRNDLALTHLARPATEKNANGKPPLLVLLHGVRSNEADLFGLAPHLDARFVVASARGPLTFGPGAYGWYPVTFTANGPIGDDETALASRETLLRFLGEAVAAYDADPARVYLGGFSQGAIMTLLTALHAPQTVAGAVTMSGRLIAPTLASRAPDDDLSGLPVLATHGLHDSVLPIDEGRAIQAALSALPVALTYAEYAMAHEINGENLSDVSAWLTARLDEPGRGKPDAAPPTR